MVRQECEKIVNMTQELLFPTFSVIVAITDKTVHMLSFTLDSILAQSYSNFEIIIIDGQSQELHHLGNVKVIKMRGSLFAMLNKGIEEARGEYIHFLLPGEFYLSRHVFSSMQQVIESHQSPDLIDCGFILRHSLSPPQTFFKKITARDLKRGTYTPSLQACWFKKEALIFLGKFNPKFLVQGGFDMLCRFYLSPHLKKEHLRRILTDYEYRLSSPKKILRQYFETLVIIYRHFGSSKALLWWIAQNQARLMRWSFKSLKEVFWKKNYSPTN